MSCASVSVNVMGQNFYANQAEFEELNLPPNDHYTHNVVYMEVFNLMQFLLPSLPYIYNEHIYTTVPILPYTLLQTVVLHSLTVINLYTRSSMPVSTSTSL